MEKWVSQRVKEKKERIVKEKDKTLRDHTMERLSNKEDSHCPRLNKENGKLKALKYWIDNHNNKVQWISEIHDKEISREAFDQCLKHNKLPGYWDPDRELEYDADFNDEVANTLIADIDPYNPVLVGVPPKVAVDANPDTVRAFYRCEYNGFIYTCVANVHIASKKPGHCYIPAWLNWNCSTPTKIVNAINTFVKNAVKLEPNMVVMGKREYSTAEYKYPCKITGQKSGLPLDEKLDDDTYPLNSDNVSLVGVETIISGVENLELLQNSQ